MKCLPVYINDTSTKKIGKRKLISKSKNIVSLENTKYHDMGCVLATLSFIAFFIFSYAYLKVVYGCVRKVHVVKSSLVNKKLSRKALQTSSAGEASQRGASLQIEKYKQAPGPLPWPIIGNLALLGQYAVPFQGFTELAKQFGDIYTLTLGTSRCLIVNNLELIKEVLNQNGKYFGGRPDFKRFHVLFGGDRNNSLALCDWSQLQQRRRNLARKHCSPRDASSFYQKMSDVGCFEMHVLMNSLSQTIEDGKDLKLKPLIQQTCANMFSQYMCSVRFDYCDKEFQSIVRCFDEIFWEINQGYAVDFLPWLSPFYTHHMNRIEHWSKTIRAFILERIILHREKNIDLDAPERDFTDALLKSLVEGNDVSRNTIIFMLEDFIGGHSAVGNLVMLALAYIVRNPEVATRIQAEIDELNMDLKESITFGDIEQMPYTLATIYEVLRYCSSPVVPHVATENVAIAGYGVTKGTIVFINNYDLNTSPLYWDKPEKFNPDRFIENCKTTPQLTSVTKRFQTIKIKKNIPHFLPFSIGKRTCIGQNIVKGFSFIMLSNILRKYDISCNDLNSIKTYPACLAVPPDTFSLKLTPRHKT